MWPGSIDFILPLDYFSLVIYIGPYVGVFDRDTNMADPLNFLNKYFHGALFPKSTSYHAI